MSRAAALAAAAALLAATLALELAGGHGAHGGGFWHALPGFDFGYGLAGCAAIVLVSKALGKLGLQRPEGRDEDRG